LIKKLLLNFYRNGTCICVTLDMFLSLLDILVFIFRFF